MNKLVSVIIPIYNREKFLKKCIDSVLNQTYSNLEIILVDDCSTDSSVDICEEFKEKDNRIKIFRNKTNQGVAYSRNVGVSMATGEYLIFVDSDDFITKYYVEFLLKLAIVNNSEMVQCKIKWSCSLDDEDDFDTNKKFNMSVWQSNIEAERALQNGCDARIGGMVCGKLYKSEIFDGLSFMIGKIHEDEGIMHQLIYNCNRIICIDSLMYYQVNSHGSIMRNTFSKKNYDAYDVIKKRYEFFKEKGLTDCALMTAHRMAGSLIDLYRKTLENLGEDNKDLLLEYERILPLYINSPYLTKENKELHLKWLTEPLYGDCYFSINYMREHFSKDITWDIEKNWNEVL